jgi:hypothetical protein
MLLMSKHTLTTLTAPVPYVAPDSKTRLMLVMTFNRTFFNSDCDLEFGVVMSGRQEKYSQK